MLLPDTRSSTSWTVTYVGYNQIFMAEEDISKTVLRCPDAIALYECIVMTFTLKNAGATY
jgi:hypothetical protein